MTHTLPRKHPTPWPLDRSAALLSEASKRIAGLTLSMMKRPEHFAPGSFPVYLSHGEGALVTDVDGNEYIDFVCGLGANSLGHNHPSLVAAVQETLRKGFIHSLPTELEVQTAQALIDVVPGAEMLRFFKTGADATSAAIRLARAVTKRDRIVTIGYNGWHDHFMFDTPGVPASVAELTTRLPLFQPDNETTALETVVELGDELAAVIISLPYNRTIEKSFLDSLRKQCTERGVLLIFDEIVTGFRLALGGAQAFFDVEPDISCYSKAVAGGMPLSAVVGRREILSQMEKLQVSTTFGGELLSLAVALKTIETCKNTNYIEHLRELGIALREGINRVSAELDTPLRIVGYDAIPFYLFHPNPERHIPLARTFQGLMAERGVLLRRDVNFLSAAHTLEQISFTVDAARASLADMRAKGLFANQAASANEATEVA